MRGTPGAMSPGRSGRGFTSTPARRRRPPTSRGSGGAPAPPCSAGRTTRTLKTAGWENSRIAERPLEDEVAALTRTPGRDILVLNSASIIHALLQAGLVDDLRMADVAPAAGQRLGQVNPCQRLRPFDIDHGAPP